MEYTANDSETLVNYLSTSTSAVNQNYSEPTVNTESLSFKMKNNYILTFSMPNVEPPETLPKIEKDELTQI